MDAIVEVLAYFFVELLGWAIGKLAHPHDSAVSQRDFGCLVLGGLGVTAVLACGCLQLVALR